MKLVITFHSKNRDIGSRECLIWDLLYSYYYSGQISYNSGQLFIIDNNTIEIIAHIFHQDAINSMYDTIYVRQDKEKIMSNNISLSFDTITTKDTYTDISLINRQDIILHYEQTGSISPINVFQNNQIHEFPLYKLPYLKNSYSHWNLIDWCRDYTAFQRLSYNGVNDDYFEYELFSPQGHIVSSGLNILKMQSELITNNIYYYLDCDNKLTLQKFYKLDSLVEYSSDPFYKFLLKDYNIIIPHFE